MKAPYKGFQARTYVKIQTNHSSGALSPKPEAFVLNLV